MAKPADSFEVNGADGPAVCGPRLADMLDDRSSLRGRWREADERFGEAGSFLTLIIGARSLHFCQRQDGNGFADH